MTVILPVSPTDATSSTPVNTALEAALAPFRRPDAVQMRIGGYTVADAVRIAGGTPAYLYDRSVMQDRARRFRAEMPPALKLLYSIKANPHPVVAGLMAAEVDGFDVASGSELQLAMGLAPSAARIQFSGPGKTRADVERAVAADVLINVESTAQLAMVAATGAALGKTPRVCLRVNPSFLPGGAGLRMTGKPSQFGIFADEVPALIAEARALGLDPMGLHFYWGTQLLNGATIAEIQLRTWDCVRNWIAELGLNITHLNLGGGLGIPYFAGDGTVDTAPIAQSTQTIIRSFHHHARQGDVFMELGRYLIGPAGVYVTTVLDVKRYGDETFVVTDGGMHHHLAATGNLGQGIHRPFPIVLAEKLDQPSVAKMVVTGCLCTPIDTFARGLPMPLVQIGDLMAILQSGAYGASASPTGFLSHEPARELVL